MKDIFTWIVAHQALVSGAVVGVLDLLFALNEKLAGSGILHQIYVMAKGVKPEVPPKV